MDIKDLIEQACELKVNLEFKMKAFSKNKKEFLQKVFVEGKTDKTVIIQDPFLKYDKKYLPFSQIKNISDIEIILKPTKIFARRGLVEIEIPMWLYGKLFF